MPEVLLLPMEGTAAGGGEGGVGLDARRLPHRRALMMHVSEMVSRTCTRTVPHAPRKEPASSGSWDLRWDRYGGEERGPGGYELSRCKMPIERGIEPLSLRL